MNGVRLLRGIARKILLLSALLVIAIALLVSVGRETIGELDRYRSNINSYASTLLGLELESQELQGEWHQLTPQVTAKGLSIYGPGQQTPAITLDHVTLDLDLIQSVLSLHVVWRELQLGRVNLTAREDAEGNWTIAGLPLSGSGDSSVLLDVLFDSAYLEIKLVSLSLEFFSGTESVLEAHNIVLENSGDFHRLLAAVNLAGKEQSAELIAEGRGDHRDFNNFDGTGYLKLNRIDFSGSLNALAKGWFPEIVERIGNIETDIKGEIWVNLAGGEASLVGQVSAAEVPLNWLENVTPLTNFKTEITGWFHPGEDWGLRLQGLDFDWGELQIEPLDINFRQSVGAEWDNGSLAVSQINLSLLDDLLVKARLAPDAIVDIVQQLQPTGNIHSLHLDLSLENKEPDVEMRANLDDVSVSSWRGAPASRHINGYIEVHNNTGLLDLDSPDGFALHYPQVFDDYMEHSAIRGQVKWRWDEENHAVKVFSGPLEFGGEEGLGRAYLYLDLPFGQTEGQPDDRPEMYLSVGVNNTHSRYRNRYLPKILSSGLIDWLDRSVGDTSIIAEAGFIWRGALSGDADLHSLQLYLNFADGHLKFQPDWPPLEQLNGILTVDDKEVDGEINSATLGKAHVKHGDVRVRSVSTGNGLQVLIDSEVTADVSDAIDVLAQSPLKSRVEGLSGWQMSGDSQINLDLTIPLSAGGIGGLYNVDTTLSQARMALPDSEISFEQLQGVLSYRNGKGLFSREIKGRFWGEPVIASLATQKDNLSIDVNGRLSMPVLGKFLKLPSDQVLQGKTEVQAKVLVPLEDMTLPLRLTINSQLQGAVINLPEPFGKEADGQRDIAVKLTFADSLDIQVLMGESLKAHLIQKNGALVRGLLTRNSERTALPEVGEFMATGHFEYFSLPEWQATVSTLLSDTGDSGSTLKPLFDVKFDQLDVAGLSFDGATVQGSHQDTGWQIGVESDLVVGQILIPEDTTSPMVLDLESLSLPTPSEAGGDADALSPMSLPHMRLSVKKFSVGNKLFGEASFLMEPQSNGVKISGIDANLLGLQVGDKEYDTSLEWTLENGRHHTLVDGLLQAGDLGNVMEAWGLPQVLDSDEAHFFTEMTWPGRPWEISTTTMKGAMSLQLQKGRFYQSPKGATKQMIRLISLFNFDNWMRRLRLDFSDLFQEGMSYDEMQGGLIFDEGTLTFDAPIVVKLPSGRVRLEGVADLISEDIDAHLVTTLPLGTNLPWIVAIAGGLPAAAGVYITGKVFKKQVDKLSSISYRITGPWNDPEISVERIFSDSTSSNKKSNNQSGNSKEVDQ